MIWHVFEVWVLMLAAFTIGCPVGALTYKLIARSPLAELQGNLADVVGDIVDGIKSRLGIGPVWRPEYRRIIERGAPDGEETDDHGDHRGEDAAQLDRLLGAGVPLITDESDRTEGGETAAGASAGIPALVTPGETNDADEGDEVATARPVGLAAPRNGVPDDLQRIRGVGRKIERRLNALGIYHFGQIAAWTPAEMHWMAHQLAFPERIEKDDWIGQAIVLAAGGDTGFVKSADRRRRRRRQKALEDAIERAVDEDGTADVESGEGSVQGASGSGDETAPDIAEEGDDSADAEKA